MAKDNLSSLYNGLINKGYSTEDIGDEATFRSMMADKKNRKQLYDYVSARKDFRIGDYETYENRLSGQPEQTETEQEPQEVEQKPLPKAERKSLQEQAGMSIAVPDAIDMAAKFAEGQTYDPNANIQKALARGELDTIINQDEEKRISAEFTPKPVVEASDIYKNYYDRFGLTERGKQLSGELATIQEGVQKKYADEFLASDDYKKLSETYTGAELDEAANTLFAEKYSGKIEEELKPYYDAYQTEALSRYQNEIGQEFEQFQKAQTAQTKDEIASDVSSLTSFISRQKEDIHNRLAAKAGTGGNAMSAIMGSRKYVQETESDRKAQAELDAAQQLIDESNNIISEAKKKGKTNFVAGLGRGLSDAIFDANTWSFGLQELRDNTLLLNALNKYDNGEQLTESEQTLMDAAVANMATNAYFYSDLGRGYKAGTVSGQSIPFMLEFAINPVSASGSAIAKSILKYGMQKFGKSAVKNNASKFAARLIGDMAAAGLMTGTTSAARVGAGAVERMTGDIQLDDTGTEYAGRENVMSAGEAVGKSAASTFLENQSEMVFNAFKGLGNKIWKTVENQMPGGIAGVMDNAILGKVGDIYRKAKSNPVLQEVARRTQFHGLAEEYLEEVYNNFANIPLGEMTLEEATDLDNNIDTFLGLAPTSVAFAALGLGGLAVEKNEHRKRIKAALGNLTRIESKRLAELERMAETAGNEDIKRFIRETITSTELTPEEKKAEIDYAYNLAVGNAIDQLETEQKNETLESHAAATEEGRAIYAEHNPQTMRETVLRREVAEQRLVDAGFTSDDIEIMKNTPVDQRQQFLSSINLEENTQLAIDYFDAYDRETALNDALDEAHAEEVAQARELLDSITLPNGTVTIVPLGASATNDTEYGVVVSGINADGSPMLSNGEVMVYPVKLTNGQLDVDFQTPMTIVPKSYTDAVIYSPDEALEGMLKNYSDDAAILDGIPMTVGAQFPIMDDNGMMSNVTILGIDQQNGRYIVSLNNVIDKNGVPKNTYIDAAELAERKKNAELAPLMQERIAEEQQRMEAEHEAITTDLAPQVANLQPQPGEKIMIAGKQAAIKEIAPDGLIVDYINESGDITGTDIVPLDAYYNYKQEQFNAQENERQNISDVSEQSGNVNDTEKNAGEQSPEPQGKAEQPYPTDERGEPAFTQMQPEQTVSLLTSTLADDASSFVADKLSEAEKSAKKAAEKKPKSLSFTERVNELGKIAEEKAKAESELQYWQNISAMMNVQPAQPTAKKEEPKKPQPQVKSITEEAEEITRKNQERLAAMTEEEIAAAQKKVQENIDKGKYDRKSAPRRRSRYNDEDVAMGEAYTPMEHVLREIATGRITFQWSDKGATQGLGSHLGLSGSNVERQKLIWALSNEGYAPEVASEIIHADMPAAMQEIVNQIDVFNMILEAFQQYGSPSRMFEVAQQLHGIDIESQRGYEEDMERQAQEWEAEQNKMSVQDWTTYLDVVEDVVEMKFGTLSDEDINTIFDGIINEINNENERGETEGRSSETTEQSGDTETGNEVLPGQQADNTTAGTESAGQEQQTETDEQGSSTLSHQGFTVEKRYHKKDNKDIFAVNFTERMDRDIFLDAKREAKNKGGYYSSFGKGGFIFETEETARNFGELIMAGIVGRIVGKAIEAARAQVEPNPTEAQKEAGNYKKGHVTVDGYNITLENPKGSERSGTDKDGKAWSVTMNNDYGYIRGTEGVDGDHIDVFLSDTPESGNVYVVDQINEDGTFDEHKVMYGFDTRADAEEAYLANYSPGWKGLGNITEVTKEQFKKWIESSHRKTKPFAEYKSMITPKKPEEVNGYKKGDKVYYGGKPATIYDFEYDGRPVLDTGLAPVIYTVADWENISPDISPITDNFGKRLINKSGDKTIAITNYDGAKGTVQVLVNEKEENLSAIEVLNMLRNDKWSEMSTLEKSQRTKKPQVKEKSSGMQQINVEGLFNDLKTKGTAKFKDNVIEETPAYGSQNKVVSTARYEELKKRMRAKLNNLNAGYDPELIAIGAEMAAYHVEAGARKFADFTKRMITDMGEEVRPYLKLFYNAVRDFPGMESYKSLMTSYQEVEDIDINTIKIEENEQTGTDRNAFESQIEAIAGETESRIEEAETAEQIEEINKEIDGQIETIDNALSSLGYVNTLHSGMRVILKDGRNVMLTVVMRQGEQINAKEFSEPQVTRLYASYKGKLIDFLPEDIDIDATIAYNVDNNVQLEKQPSAPVKKAPSKGNMQKTDNAAGFGDLFSGVNEVSLQTETLNRTDNEQERGSETKDTGVGETTRQEDGRADRAGMDSGSTGSVGTEQPGSGRNAGIPSGESTGSTAGKTEPQIKNTRNNRNERGIDYAPRSPKARYAANVKAIKLMRQLMNSGEQPTREQMEVLRRYSGWGGMGTYFNNTDTEENKQLRELLTDEEYDAAANSGNSAYYTPAQITDSLWDIVEKLGFKGGNILEGSAGIGNILGAMPQSISEKSNIHAVEIDKTSGNILSLLYPDAKVDIQGFEDTRIRNGSVDLAITNVPFVADLTVYDKIDKDLSAKFPKIQDFCIAKNVRKLREGGLGVFITSSITMDNSANLREWLVNEGNADFIGAFRLNNKTFEGADVTTDIIVVRKRTGKKVSPVAIDALKSTVERTGSYDTKETEWNKKERRWEPVKKDVVLEYNTYYQQHPENMGGEMFFGYEKGNTYRPGTQGLYPVAGKNQNELLKNWVNSFTPIMDASYHPQQVQEIETEEKNGTLFADKEGNFFISDMGVGVPLNLNANKIKGYDKTECLNDYNAIKTSLNDVLEYQINNQDDKGLQPLLDRLNEAYDTFVSKYGSLNKNTAISFLKNDVDFPSIAALEDYKEYKNAQEEKVIDIKKTNVFDGRVIGFQTEPEPKDVKDGVIASIYKNGYIDLPYIAEKLGKSVEQVEAEILKEKIGFVNPVSGAIEVRYEYLSGNVRQKLEEAKTNNTNGEYNTNIAELEKVIPMDIPAHLIDFSLGSSWIDPKLYIEYIQDRYGVSGVSLNHVEGAWNLIVRGGVFNEKNRAAGVYSEMFKETIYATDLVAAALNNRTVQVKKVIKGDKTKETQYDREATQTCVQRIEEIKDDFKEWMRNRLQQDEELAAQVTRTYNDKFNNMVPKEIDDMFLPERFGGASQFVNLYTHQKRAVIKGTTQPLLLAHEVGSGKTFTLISTAMEMRRLGTAKKPMIVVQNATVAQFVADAKKVYPNAKVLTITERDRTPEGRRAFYGRIKYSDWDMIIIPQSTFEMIPDSPERQLTFIQERIEEKQHAIEMMQETGVDENQLMQAERELENIQIEMAELTERLRSGEGPAPKTKKKDAKREEKVKQNVAARAKKQLDRRTDEVQYFDEMGVDAILIDEAHEYKRLGFSTAMTRGVKGIDPAGSKKAAGVYLKTRAVLEKNGWKNVVFATGTPISNTAAEIWTFMRYLMPKDVLKANEIYYFDDFVRNFGSISQSLEFTTSGKFKENTRFASYINKPELIRLWATVSDTVLTKEIGYVNSKIPSLEKGIHQDVFLPQSDSLISIMNAVRERLEEFEKMSGKEKRKNSHIPLTMYGIAKRAAIDTRLVDANAPDEPLSKTNKAVEETLKSLEETKDYKGTVAIFCDNQRRWDGPRVGFDLFEDIKAKLIEKGVPENQIVIMKPGMSIQKKQKIFDDVNAGTVRVVIGNTQTLGTGVNIQERLHTLIHMDAPDRPMDYTQRNGRILRQGNLHKVWNKPVRILRFGVEDSLDVTSYQRLKTKAAFIDSIMDGKSALANNQENRTLEEEEEGLFDNPVAILSGSQYALLKNAAERELRKYSNKKKQWETDQIYVVNRLARNKGLTVKAQQSIDENEQQLAKVKALFPDGKVNTLTYNKKKLTTAESVDEAFKEINKAVKAMDETARKDRYFPDTTLPFEMELDGNKLVMKVTLSRSEEYDYKQKATLIKVRRNLSFDMPAIGIKDYSVMGAYARNILEYVEENIVTGTEFTDVIEVQQASIEAMVEESKLLEQRKGKPFEFDKELEEAQKKVDEYTELMKAEMKEKEAKYAGRGSKNVDLSTVESEEEQDEAQADDEVRFRIEDEATGEIRYRTIDDVQENELSDKLSRLIYRTPVKSNPLYNVNNVNLELYSISGPYMRRLPKPGERHVLTEGNIDIEHAKNVYKKIRPVLNELKKELISMIPDATIPARKEIASYIHAIDNNISYYKELSEGKDVWRTRPLYRFVQEQQEVSRYQPVIDAIQAEAGKLGIKVNVYTSMDEVPAGAARRAIEKGLRVKGWYQNGQINIYLPNAAGMEDVKATLLHEGVAHYGLRQLVGEQNFNEFIGKLYAQASKEVREGVMKLAPKYGYNIYEAMEEYIASMAEKGIDNPTFWQTVRKLFRDMLEKIGIKLDITDNDLRYLLWESRNNLRESANPVSVAKETTMRKKLGIGMFGKEPTEETRFRFEDRPQIIQQYDETIKSNAFRFQEAFQDSMLALKELQTLIENFSGKKIRTFENAYTAENRLSSVNKQDNEKYMKKYFEPLVEQIKKMSGSASREEVEDYIYAKSGLERNEVFLKRDADKAFNESKKELDAKLDKGDLTQDQYDALIKIAEADYQKAMSEPKDYSGLEGLVLKARQDELEGLDEKERAKKEKEIAKEYKQHAENVVSEFEAKIPASETARLWQLINDATNETLRIQFDSGMISGERYDELKGMMKYYVPLKSWSEQIAEDVYEYTRREAPVQKEKAAKGRKSLAANPIANIALSAQNAIILGNRNKMKQRFFNFVINRPNPLATVSDVWYAKTIHTVHDQVEPVYPDINETDGAEEIQQKLEDFENEMKELEERGMAFRRKVPMGVELVMKKFQKPEHMVQVMINGQEYVIYINGNPRAAQAINGKTNPEGEENIFWEYYNKAKRLYGGGLTSNNPDFVIANFVRDSIHSATMEFMNNGLVASLNYLKNVPSSVKTVSRGVTGIYDSSNQMDVYFKEFVENGGETGYTAIHTLEDYKKEYEKLLQEVKGAKKALKAGKKSLDVVISVLETANRIAEDINRFNAYVSSRQAGKTIEESVDAAKNITVNFNKKGSLGKGSGAWAALAWFMNKWILFFNPAVQGLYQVGQAAKKNKRRVQGTLGAVMSSGFIMPYINSLLISAFGGGDDDDYFNQTDYTRMNNWLLFTGDGYVKIPLPPFFREWYGLGDILHRMLTGRMTPEKATVATARQLQSLIGFINLIPSGEPSIAETVAGMMPDLVAPLMDVALNRDFTGRDIAKDAEYTKNLPEYERIYKGVSPVYVSVSRMLNEIGGDEARRSPYFGTFINPAYMEHLVTSYTGGIGKTISNVVGMATDAVTGETDNIEFRTVPVVNRFYAPVTDRTVTSAVNRVFYEYQDRYEAARVAEKRYKEFIKDGRKEFRKELEQMKKNGEADFISYFGAKMKILRKKQDRLKENPDDKRLEAEIRELKSQMIMRSKKLLE